MKSTPDNPLSGGTVPDPASYNETLRLIAHAPVPAGIEERVQAALQAAPRHGRVFSWPVAKEPSPSSGASAWMRAAAAAAIVFVVAGGGWGIFHRVQRPMVKVVVMPAAQPAAGGFSAAGAIRTPRTVKGPVLVPPAAKPDKAKDRKKVTARTAAPASRAGGPVAAQPKQDAVTATAASR